MPICKQGAVNNSFPILDDEFDKFASIGQMPFEGQHLGDDLSWEEQINDWHELSL